MSALCNTFGKLSMTNLLHNDDCTDGELLEALAGRYQEAAMTALLRRHGPMVQRVCRRVLGNIHDAEEAFQATFIVLVKKANAVRRQELLGNWLYGVAYRIALKARASASKRYAQHVSIGQIDKLPESRSELTWSDMQPILDREVNRLPEKYRRPIILCYLEGRTNDEAAEQLGWTRGMIASRMSQARKVLRRRLARYYRAACEGTCSVNPCGTG